MLRRGQGFNTKHLTPNKIAQERQAIRVSSKKKMPTTKNATKNLERRADDVHNDHLTTYRVEVPKHLLILSIAVTCLLGFTVGRWMKSHFAAFPTGCIETSCFADSSETSGLLDANKIPRAVSKNTSNPSHNGTDTCMNDDECTKVDKSVGQHWLLDFANLDRNLLDSEANLLSVVTQIVEQSGFTLLRSHCQRPKSNGLSCVAVLLEGYIVLHSWPKLGMLSFDMHVGGISCLGASTVDMVKDLFFVGSENPRLMWAVKKRGFQDASDHEVEAFTDMFLFPVGTMLEYKNQVTSVETDFQSIVIYDVLEKTKVTQQHGSAADADENSYKAQHLELFQPDRMVFMDGVLQSRRQHDASYHEALVHPALFAHANPKRVAIIGGGEGATLREVLKHNTVERVTMIEIDEGMVIASRDFLPEWNDCSNLVGREANCFDDPKAEIHFCDAFKWFKDRFSQTSSISEPPFDVIIMDALDPQALPEVVEALYTDPSFYESLYNGLDEGGILVSQLGEALRMNGVYNEHSHQRHRLGYVEGLVEAQFARIREYSDGHCGFYAPWAFIVAFKSEEEEESWFASESTITAKIHKRAVPTIRGEPSLLYFDGATMADYQHVPKPVEVLYCQSYANESGCDPSNNSTTSEGITEACHSIPSVSSISTRVWDSVKNATTRDVNSSSTWSDFMLQALPQRQARPHSYNPALDRNSPCYTEQV